MYIKDNARHYCLNAINNHIKRQGSILITAQHGCGKTELLKQIKNTQDTVRARSLGSLYQVLGRIAGVKEPTPMRKGKYLDQRCNHPATVIIDEAQDLPSTIWPYIKIMIDAGNSFILAGRPEIKDALEERHPDVLSRLTHIPINLLAEDDMYQLVKDDFDQDAFSVIYAASYDMRVMMTQVANCRDYMHEQGLKRIDVMTASRFVSTDNHQDH